MNFILIKAKRGANYDRNLKLSFTYDIGNEIKYKSSTFQLIAQILFWFRRLSQQNLYMIFMSFPYIMFSAK